MKKRINKTKILMIIYCILVVWIILFKLSLSINDLEEIRRVVFIPFSYYCNTAWQRKQIIENILIFIPFGIYLKLVNIKNKKAVLSGFCFSLILEIFQYILRVGVTDTTDIITNTLGTCIGIIIYEWIVRIFKDKLKIDKLLEKIAFVVTVLFSVIIIIILLANK